MSGFTLAPFHTIEHLMWRARQNKVNATDAYLQNKFVSDSSENGSSCSVFYSGIMVNNDLL